MSRFLPKGDSPQNRNRMRVPEGLAAAETATERADVIPLTASLADWGKQHFAQDDCLIFVGSAGIAVRTIGPLAVSKRPTPPSSLSMIVCNM